KYFKYMKYERYGQLILFGLLMSNLLDRPLDMVIKAINGVMWGIVNLFI
ncbi:MAG TPA: site-2 protease family protein, partial [Clostridium sp.]|nr:site-2 protease family protein [Clostridium sp.]